MLLEIEDGIAQMIVVPHIVRTLNVETFGVFCKGSGVVISLFLLVTHITHAAAALYHEVVNQYLA